MCVLMSAIKGIPAPLSGIIKTPLSLSAIYKEKKKVFGGRQLGEDRRMCSHCTNKLIMGIISLAIWQRAPLADPIILIR